MKQNWQPISVAEAKRLIAERDPLLIDIRDKATFAAEAIPGAHHGSNETIQSLLVEIDPAKPIIVYCYHGNSSQLAADFIAAQGFTEVYSLSGGYAAWM